MQDERAFATTPHLTIPVDEITGIEILGEREGPWPFITLPPKMVIHTEDGTYAIEDSFSAKRFIHTLGKSTNITGVRLGDLEREIDKNLPKK